MKMGERKEGLDVHSKTRPTAVWQRDSMDPVGVICKASPIAGYQWPSKLLELDRLD